MLEETGEKTLNLSAYCIGGTLTATMLAIMAKTGDKRVKSCTFFTALTDFEDAGDLQVFVDENTLEVVDDQMDKGFLPAEAMATTFNMLRSTDLIWNYVVSNYYLGKEPFPFDLLYWNADSVAMPAKLHHYYLERFYNDNAFSRGELRMLNVDVTISDIKVPVYAMASKEDHIAPAAAVYRGVRMMTGARERRFVLAGSGHIAAGPATGDAGRGGAANSVDRLDPGLIPQPVGQVSQQRRRQRRQRRRKQRRRAGDRRAGRHRLGQQVVEQLVHRAEGAEAVGVQHRPHAARQAERERRREHRRDRAEDLRPQPAAEAAASSSHSSMEQDLGLKLPEFVDSLSHVYLIPYHARPRPRPTSAPACVRFTPLSLRPRRARGPV